MTTQTATITAEQLFQMGDIGRCELIRGEIVMMAPAGAEHGEISLEFGTHIRSLVKAKKLGKTYGAETGFIIARNPDTTRAPDVGFVGTSRVPPGRLKGFFPGAPDLAVEVVSPSDAMSDVLEKVDEWLAAGTVSVWVVEPRSRTVVVYRANNVVLRYGPSDELRDEPTLPGFAMKVSDLFDSD